MLRRFVLLSILVGLAMHSAAAHAAYSSNLRLMNPMNHLLSGTSVGFGVIDDTGFVTTVQADYYVHDNWTIGGQMLFFVGNPQFVWSPQGVIRYGFDLPGTGWTRYLQPFGQMLLGFAITDNGSTDAALLAGFGIGADYFLTNRLTVGSTMDFQFSNDLFGENFAYIWKVLTFKYLF